ncbi:MAG: transcriptional regulator [Pelodictyon luteolum]|uniref:Transcriptional regulator, XRE family n=2 Tax=Pelodictyon luteolum TaxID=1100 RepID=Q3B427_CHLL3|nr:helix-turn-helix domain-containing protein [Pelodictyon luteolum]ABB23904.1 transcriptional regulator, XRE family [Pelodictyon luteolum DSM 273]KZK74278.1 MAG: transcriptional regulator [Pelodictyon luteolum]
MHSDFDSIRRGLEEAIAYMGGEDVGARVYRPRPIDVKVVREKTGLTQERFAAAFGISVATLRHWERGDRKPHGPALVLLDLVRKAPDTVLGVLNEDEAPYGE